MQKILFILFFLFFLSSFAGSEVSVQTSQDLQGRTVTTVISSDAVEASTIDINGVLAQVTPKFEGYIVELNSLPVLEVIADDSKVLAKLEGNQEKIQERINEAIEDKINHVPSTTNVYALQRSADIVETKLDDIKEQIQDDVTEQKAVISSEKNQFLDKMEDIPADAEHTGNLISGNAVASVADTVVESFDTVINAVVLDVSAEQIAEIEKLPEVKKVTPNYEVKAFLMDSVPLIGANQVWQLDVDGNNCVTSGKECLTGKGVNIAIIDTGVDYTHPDLGGCFGAGCKVVGGWDFVNNDGDPMDDQGHGTHVAATAAGNGALKGVAPDATIYAYKVLAADGGGTTANIIAAINKAVDPNGDGDFSDKLEVISLSLGGPGDPDDPMSTAIDNAVNNGVVAVVAAGNSGPSEVTIGSPGTARKAITVGATYKKNYDATIKTDINPRVDSLAFFSSRGPTTIGTVKPDIVAPGAKICAAQWGTAFESSIGTSPLVESCLDSNHIAISGTSMATPHVAGVVALLKQKNPTWTPAEIKAALKATAKDLGLRRIEQGSGRVDVFKLLALANAPAVSSIVMPREVGGVINIQGSITGSFTNYFVSYSSASANNWVDMPTQTSFPSAGVLISGFDTTALADGEYIFKVTAVGSTGVISDDVIYSKVNNLQLQWTTSDIIRAGGIIDVRAKKKIAGTPIVEYGRGLSPTTWLNTGISNAGNNIGDDVLLATFDTSVITEADFYTLRVKFQETSSVEQISVYLDPSLRAGWPQKISANVLCPNSLPCYMPTAAPIVSDVNNDGVKEIIVADSVRQVVGVYEGSVIHVFRPDGTELSGWPKIKGDSWSIFSTPAVVQNPSTSIVNGFDFLHLYDSSGNSFSGWPKIGLKSWCPSFADIDSDNSKDVVVGRDGGTQGTYSAFDKQGNPLSGWPVLVGGNPILCPLQANGKIVATTFGATGFTCTIGLANGIFFCGPYYVDGSLKAISSQGAVLWTASGFAPFTSVVGDINGDGVEELVSLGNLGLNKGCEVRAYDANGQLMNGWPKGVQCRSTGLALADISGDGTLDIVTLNKVFSWNGNVIKTVLSNYPPNRQYFRLTVGDVNNDNREDIVTQYQEFDAALSLAYTQVIAYDLDGNILFSKRLKYPSWENAPAIVDIDGDSSLELIAVDGGQAYVWNLNSLVGKVSWPSVNFDAAHTNHPITEICNNVDDNNNGIVDEGTVLCGLGACAATVPKCQNGQSQICTPGTPTTESCNEIDDDCDGLIDNGITCADNSEFIGAMTYSTDIGVSFLRVLTFKNIGTSTWTKQSGYKLVSDNPFLNNFWGFSEVSLSDSDSIAPGQSKSFDLGWWGTWNPGTYNLNWIMAKQVGQDVIGFGAASNTVISVNQRYIKLKSITVGTSSTDIVFSNDFSTCAYIQPAPNFYASNICFKYIPQAGSEYQTESILSTNSQFTVGQKYKLCHGNNGVCSGEVVAGSPEVCNGLDDNYDGQVDEGLTTSEFFQDQDNDGFGSPTNSIRTCYAQNGYVSNSNDCDDTNPLIKPNAMTSCGVGACQASVLNCLNGILQSCVPGTSSSETCGNNIDDDCDGIADTLDSCITCTLRKFSVASESCRTQGDSIFCPENVPVHFGVDDGQGSCTLINCKDGSCSSAITR